MIAETAVILAALGLAFGNGANDNTKGVATLLGSNLASYRGALLFATLTTLAGSLTAIVFGQTLLHAFSGKGLVSQALLAQPAFLASVSIAAALTILFATRLGLPTSTTHAILGGLVGVGIAADSVHWQQLSHTFVLPLLLSPILAALGTTLLYPPFAALLKRSGFAQRACLCVGQDMGEIGNGAVATLRATPALTIEHGENCQLRDRGALFQLTGSSILDSSHYISAGAVSFSRGLNDTPKIAALLLAAQAFALSTTAAIGAVGLFIAVGGLLRARAVAHTLSRKITDMSPEQGLVANLVTAGLVLGASRVGVPVSTTHVSCGALFGIGTIGGGMRWKTVASILLAWLATLPVAAIAAVLIFQVLR